MTATRPVRLGVGVVGFGWMGQAHSRSVARIPALFPERTAEGRLVICSDTVEARRQEAVGGFGFAEATSEWRKVVEHPDVDIVYVTAPTMLHVEIVEAAAAAGRTVFCEKPVGGTPAQTAQAERAVRRAGVISGVGYNYRWAPLVLQAKALIDDRRLGTITGYRGRFFSCYGGDPAGVLSWRFRQEEGGFGVTADLLSHVLDLAMFLLGPISAAAGAGGTVIGERPLPSGAGTHYDRVGPGGPTGAVTNEDQFAGLVRFERGVLGTFDVSRTSVGPEAEHTVEVYGTEGALRWNFERMNELSVSLAGDGPPGFTTVHAGGDIPYHHWFVPGRAHGIGFEDLVTIEDHAFLEAVAAGRPFEPGLDAALAYAGVQDALLRSWESGRFEPVRSLRRE